MFSFQDELTKFSFTIHPIKKDLRAVQFGWRVLNGPDGEYMTTCKAGSSKRVNVQTRVRLMGVLLETPQAAEIVASGVAGGKKRTRKK